MSSTTPLYVVFMFPNFPYNYHPRSFPHQIGFLIEKHQAKLLEM